jgi:membrane fusion protein, multidrug efflux system
MLMPTGSRGFLARKRRLIILLMATATVATAAGAALRLTGRNAPSAGEGTERLIPVQVRVLLATDRQSELALSGEVEVRQSVSVGFRVGGLVGAVAVNEGQSVRRGQLLAALDPEDYRLQLELARAAASRVTDQFERARVIHAQGRLAAADYAAAESGAREAGAHEQLAMRALENTRLMSPLNGVVAYRAVQPGEQVGPGTPVFTIVDLDPAQVRVGVPEREIGRVRAGMRARIAIPSLPGWTGEGEIERVGVVPDPVSRTYAVRISLANPGMVLRPGMIAGVRIEETSRVTALTLPGEAILRDPSGSAIVYVYVPDQGRVFARRIKVGALQGREVEIISGVGPDELIVVGGQHRVRDGSFVEARR